jgi:hypothetical protein
LPSTETSNGTYIAHEHTEPLSQLKLKTCFIFLVDISFALPSTETSNGTYIAHEHTEPLSKWHDANDTTAESTRLNQKLVNGEISAC